MLIDSGHLQEEDAKHRYGKEDADHEPAVPLYTAEDAQNALPFFHATDYDTVIQLAHRYKPHSFGLGTFLVHRL